MQSIAKYVRNSLVDCASTEAVTQSGWYIIEGIAELTNEFIEYSKASYIESNSVLYFYQAPNLTVLSQTWSS